jgi:hypothetical protein
MALTALWQPGESLATLRWRHCRASAPPGLTLEQFDMKSERQLLRSAFCWAWVGCAMAPAVDIRKLAAKRANAVNRPAFAFNAMTLPSYQFAPP